MADRHPAAVGVGPRGDDLDLEAFDLGPGNRECRPLPLSLGAGQCKGVTQAVGLGSGVSQ